MDQFSIHNLACLLIWESLYLGLSSAEVLCDANTEDGNGNLTLKQNRMSY
jgi:hypothetical protein